MWGWTPAEVHTHEYDGDRLVRTVVERESAWDAEQLEFLVALSEFEASVNEWGVPLAEATSIDADPNNPERKYTYKVDTPIDWVSHQVHTALEGAAAGYEGKRDPYRASRKVRVSRVERD